MIPADVASRLQISADSAQRPVAPAQEIVDKIPGLVAGQKVMAGIQSLLPNGTYRALINQRSITLALPFSAKSGDALELQVTESNGRLALAVVSRQGEGAQSGANASATTLSRTGQLISNLFSGARQAQGNANALPLNSNQPISNGPVSAQQLLPLLKQAITQSVMFYESHQAEWVEGRFAKASLLQEPQGKLSSPSAFVQSQAQNTTQTAASTGQQAGAALAAANTTETAGLLRATAEGGASPASAAEAGKANAAQQAGQLIAPQTQPLVQQQLEALATHNFSWQGQIWPGQEMRWEIDEDGRQHGQDVDETDDSANWSTRLHLVLPNLGEVDAKIQLQGNRISLSMSADSEQTRAAMRASGLALRNQLDEAGITLASLGISAGEPATSEKQGDGQADE